MRRVSATEKKSPARSARSVFRYSRSARPEEEALDLGTARLVETVDGRGYFARGAGQSGQSQDYSATARRVAEERTGRAFV